MTKEKYIEAGKCFAIISECESALQVTSGYAVINPRIFPEDSERRKRIEALIRLLTLEVKAEAEVKLRSL